MYSIVLIYYHESTYTDAKGAAGQGQANQAAAKAPRYSKGDYEREREGTVSE